MTEFDLLTISVATFSAIEHAFVRGRAERRAVFEYHMHGAPFFMVAGVERLADEVAGATFSPEQLAWLASQGVVASTTQTHLQSARITCNIDAVREGTTVASHLPFVAIEGPYWQARLIADGFARRVEAATRAASAVARVRCVAPNLTLIDDLSHRALHPADAAEGSELAGSVATTNLEAAYSYGTTLALRELAPKGAELATQPRGGNLTIVPCAMSSWSADHKATLDLVARRELFGGDDASILLEVELAELSRLAPAISAAFRQRRLAPPKLLVAGVRSLQDVALLSTVPDVHALYTFSGLDTARLQCDVVAEEDEGRWASVLRLGGTFLQSSDPGRKIVMRYLDANGSPLADVAHGTSERMPSAHEVTFVERATGFSRAVQAVRSEPLRVGMLRGGMRSEPSTPHRERLLRARASLDDLARAHPAPTAEAPMPFGLSVPLDAAKTEQVASELHAHAAVTARQT